MTIAEYIHEQCIIAGMTEAGTDALLGNIEKESCFQANNLEDRANRLLHITDEQYTQMVDSGQWTDFATDNGVHGGYGLIQVTLASRKKLFLDFMKSRGKSIADVEGQVAFILWEMRHMFPTVWKTVTTSTDLYACTKIILDVYENPEEKIENLRVRYEYAQKWFQYFGNKGVKSSMTQKEAIEKVLNLARAEVGYHEKSSNTQLDDKYANGGSGNYTKYARELDALGNFYNGPKNGFAWCDVVIDWLFVKCFGADIGRQMVCQPLQSAGAGCLYSVQYYKQAGRWGNYPQPGDQIFFSYTAGEYSHTGIVESVSNGSVVTIEGNSSDQVARRTYALGNSSIAGYGRPRWELVADVSADAAAPAPDDNASLIKRDEEVTFSLLKRGSKSEKVHEYQTKLIQLGYNLGRWGADGDFGTDTYHAVKAFQQDHGVTVDGEIGPVTAAAIEKAIAELNQPAAQPAQAAEAQSAAAKSIVDKIKPNPVTVITAPLEAEEPVDDGYQFHIGDIVNFIGNGHYMSATAKVGFKCKPGKAMIRAVNRAATTKHPYRISAVRGGGSTVNGWVDEDAIQKV